MTEAKWLAATDPNPLLTFLQGNGSSERKRRLLACAFGRELGTAIKDERFWSMIATGERWADEGEPDNWLDVYETALDFQNEAYASADLKTSIATLEALRALSPDPLFMFVRQVPTGLARLREISRDLMDRLLLGVSYRKRKPYPQHWCGLIREVFGNPFRPVTFSPEWRTDTTIALARQMYESRDFSAMPILADAIQDAGCDSDDILSHCRGGGPHVRGCWVVDLVLGKE